MYMYPNIDIYRHFANTGAPELPHPIIVLQQAINDSKFLYMLIHLFICFSPDLPENEATFAVTSGGIADAKE